MLEQEKIAFQRDGVVVIRGLFKDWLALLEQGVQQNEQQPGPWFKDYSPEKTQGQFWADYCNWQRIQPFKDFIEQSPAAYIAKTIMGAKHVRIFHEHVLVKAAGSNKATPWHHDAPYYPVDAQQTLSLWIPLDPVERESAIEFIAGSHQWGQHFRPQSFNGEYYDHGAAKEVILPDIDAQRDAYDIVGWALEPGDAIAFDYLTVHGAPGNLSNTHARRAVSFRWLGDHAVYVDRGGKTSPQYPHLIGVLRTGDALPEDEFPIMSE